MKKYESLLMLVIAVSSVVSLDMAIDIPNQDFPDLKDIPALFPSVNPPQEESTLPAPVPGTERRILVEQYTTQA